MPALRKRWTDEDFERFEELCRLQCPEYEICASMDTSAKTLKRILAEHYGETLADELGPAEAVTPGKVIGWFAAQGRARMRAMVFEQAEGGDTALVRELARMYMADDGSSKKTQQRSLEKFRRQSPKLKATG